MYSLATAAAACGVNRSTILRAIKSGKISAVRNEHNEWDIQPSAVHRVYPPVARTDAQPGATQHGVQQDATVNVAPATAALEVQIAALREVNGLLASQLEDTKEEKNRWRSMAEHMQRQLPAPPPAAATAESPPARATPPVRPERRRGWLWRRAG